MNNNPAIHREKKQLSLSTAHILFSHPAAAAAAATVARWLVGWLVGSPPLQSAQAATTRWG